MENSRQFRGVWIPKEIWLTKELTQQEKLMLVEIDSLEDEEKGCYASNKHFTELFGINSSRISQIVQNLIKKGFINVEYERNGKEIVSRHIRINRPPYPSKWGYVKNEHTYVKNINGVCQFSKGGYVNFLKENNTLSNNTINIIKDIVEYLNFKTNSNYKYTTKKTQDLIKARINENFTVEDFKTVIDKKTIDWLNTDMQKFLRPETLFGTKFESYLNQPTRKVTLKDIKLSDLGGF